MTEFGRQTIVLCEQCSDSFINDVPGIITAIQTLVKKFDLHPIAEVQHVFEPVGLTFVTILAESHLLVHTWPEKRTMSVDLFVCQDQFSVEAFVTEISLVCQAERVRWMYSSEI